MYVSPSQIPSITFNPDKKCPRMQYFSS